MIFSTDRMNLNNLGDALTLQLVPPSGKNVIMSHLVYDLHAAVPGVKR